MCVSGMPTSSRALCWCSYRQWREHWQQRRARPLRALTAAPHQHHLHVHAPYVRRILWFVQPDAGSQLKPLDFCTSLCQQVHCGPGPDLLATTLLALVMMCSLTFNSVHPLQRPFFFHLGSQGGRQHTPGGIACAQKWAAFHTRGG
jgi:hypothetical protein